MRAAASALLVVLLSTAVTAQDGTSRTTTVGMRARIEQLVLPGPERIAKPVEPDDPIVLRVVEAWPHGTAFRYDLEYYGLSPGTHDLADYLVRADGVDEDLPPIEVEISSILPPGQVVPNALAEQPPPSVGGYQTFAILAAVAWAAGLIAILFAGRRRRREAQAEARPVTLADRLRPMVEAARAGRLDATGKAQLERLLLAYWTRRLGLSETKPAHAFAELRRDPEAGALLRQLEEWLHRPEPRVDVDVATWLEPYRGVAAAEFPEPAGAGSEAR